MLTVTTEKLGVAQRCSYQNSLDSLFELAKGKATIATREKFPAVVFLNADSDNVIVSLKALKAHKTLKRIPVVCLGYPKPHDEIVALYEMGAASYIVKPGDFETMLHVSETALNYWLDTTLLPQQLLDEL